MHSQLLVLTFSSTLTRHKTCAPAEGITHINKVQIAKRFERKEKFFF